MPAVQTTYAAQHARWVEGMVLNMEPNVIVTRLAEDVEGIGFGKVGVQGTADNQVVDPKPRSSSSASPSSTRPAPPASTSSMTMSPS